MARWLKTAWSRVVRAMIEECPVCETDEFLEVTGGCVTCVLAKGGCGYSGCSVS